MRRALNAPRKALTRWPPSEPRGSRMAVAGLCWCTPPDHLQEYDEYGAPVPKHVEFALELQLTYGDVNEKKLIVVRWSDVKALHAALAPTWGLSSARGYTNAMAHKFAEGKTFMLTWGSCLDARVANKRLSVIATYLEMVLGRLRDNAHVMSFIAHGRARIEAWGAKALGAATNIAALVIIAATTTPTTTTSTTTTSSRITTTTAAQLSPFTHAVTTQMQDKRIKECAAVFLRQYDVRSWSGGSVLAALGVPPPSRARENEKNAAEAMEFLLVDGHLLAPFLDTYGIRSVSQCCKAWRPVVHQTTVLRPRSAHDLSKRAQERTRSSLNCLCPSRRRVYEEWRDGHEGGWDGLIKLLAEGAYPELQTLDFQIGHDDVLVRFHLTPEPAARLFSSFDRLPQLLHLDLAGHTIGDGGAIALAKALQHTPQLKHLDLSGAKIGDAGMVALAETFKYIPHLEFLGLGQVFLKLGGANALVANLKYLPQLKNFALPRNYKRTILSRVGTDLPGLQFLTLNMSVDSYDACLLGAQLGALPKLELLDLRLPRWGARAVTNMVEAANRGRGMPPHVRVTEKHTHCCKGWRKALPTHGLPEEKFKRTGMMYDSEDKSEWAQVLEFNLPGSRGITFATQWGYDD